MPIFETANGRRMDLLLPGGTPWPELNEATQAYKKLLRERRAATPYRVPPGATSVIPPLEPKRGDAETAPDDIGRRRL